ncbi:hypothetical protein B0H12DRAFT_1146002, partial [Mycena haematopus]
LPTPSSSRPVVPNLLFDGHADPGSCALTTCVVSHRLTIFLSCTLTPSVLIPVSEPSPFLPDFVLPPARDITHPYKSPSSWTFSRSGSRKRGWCSNRE